jgi:hypothetical protein
LRRILTGGDEGIGTVAVTDSRVVFMRAKGAKQRLTGTSTVRSAAEITSLLEDQGGYVIELTRLDDVSITFSGFGRYGHGRGPCSELTVIHGGGTIERALRFYGKDTAGNLKNLLESRK